MKPSIDQLPEFYVAKLPQLGMISLSGEEQEKYLQGQVTCDVNQLPESKLLHGSHCDAKGKLFSCFRLIEKQGKLLLIQTKASIEASLKELNKFGVFAKVDIEEEQSHSIALVGGELAQSKLTEILGAVPDALSPVIEIEELSVIYIAGSVQRYLVVAPENSLDSVIEKLSAEVVNPEIWNLLEITQGFPQVSQESSQTYVPQMLNMQAIAGISFTKGCYLGQETVARMQYLGKNKKAMFALVSDSNVTAVDEDLIIEKQLGENWRKAGDVISSYLSDEGQLYLQAVLASDTESTASFKLKSNGSELSIYELPYHIQNEE